MGAATKLVDKKILEDLDPINQLDPDQLDELASKSNIVQFLDGQSIFDFGSTSSRTLYLISGKVELTDKKGKKKTIKGGSKESYAPIDDNTPSRYTARAKSLVSILSVDSDILDLLVNWNDSTLYEVTEIPADDDSNWINCLLQIPALQRLSPDKLQALMTRIEQVNVKAGDVIVKQDETDDYYYIITQGRFSVTRKPSPTSKDIQLAVLGAGQSFGEEALISEGPRNATITAHEEGLLLRLEQNDFKNLLQVPLLNYISVEKAKALLDDGAMIIDVRSPEKYAKNGAGVNIPLSLLRLKAGSIDRYRKYIINCDSNKQSAIAGFLLTQMGLDVFLLRGGIDGIRESIEPKKDNSNKIVDLKETKLATKNGPPNEKSPKAPTPSETNKNPISDKDCAISSDKQRILLNNKIEKMTVVAEKERGVLKNEIERIKTEAENAIKSTRASLNNESKRATAAEKSKTLLQNEIDRLRNEHERAISEGSNVATGRGKELQKSLDEMKYRLDTEIQRSESLENTRHNLERDISEMRISLEQAKKQVESGSLRVTELESRASAGHNEIEARLNKEISELKLRLENEIGNSDSSNKIRTELEQNIATLRVDLDSARRETGTYTHRISELEKLLEDSKNNIDNDLTTQLRALELRLSEEKRRAESLDRDCNDLTENVTKLRGELESTHARSLSDSTKISELERQIKDGHNQHDTTESKIRLLQSQLDDERVRTVNAEDSLKNAEQEILAVRSEAYENRKRSDLNEKVSRDTEEQNKSLKENESKLHNSIQELQNELSKNNARSEDLTKIESELENQNAHLHSELEIATNKINEITSNASKDNEKLNQDIAELKNDSTKKIHDIQELLDVENKAIKSMEKEYSKLEKDISKLRKEHDKEITKTIEKTRKELKAEFERDYETRIESEIETAVSLRETQLTNKLKNEIKNDSSGSDDEIKQLRSEIRSLKKKLSAGDKERTHIEQCQATASLNVAQTKIKKSGFRKRLIAITVIICLSVGYYLYSDNVNDNVTKGLKKATEISAIIPEIKDKIKISTNNVAQKVVNTKNPSKKTTPTNESKITKQVKYDTTSQEVKVRKDAKQRFEMQLAALQANAPESENTEDSASSSESINDAAIPAPEDSLTAEAKAAEIVIETLPEDKADKNAPFEDAIDQ